MTFKNFQHLHFASKRANCFKQDYMCDNHTLRSMCKLRNYGRQSYFGNGFLKLISTDFPSELSWQDEEWVDNTVMNICRIHDYIQLILSAHACVQSSTWPCMPSSISYIIHSMDCIYVWTGSCTCR